MVNAGELTKKITIQKRQRIQNSFGEYIDTWVTYRTAWAKIVQTTSISYNKELYVGNKRVTKSRYEITIRYFVDIKTRFRIIYKNFIFDIKFINNIDEKNEELFLDCEVVDDGKS